MILLYRNLCYNVEFYKGTALPLYLGPNINGLVTDRNTKVCCRGSVFVLFQSTTANKMDSEHTREYRKLFPACNISIASYSK